MAKPPSYIDQVNAIVDFIDNPCDAPWTVYLETAREPAGNLAIALLAFGMDDVIRGYFRPKGLRSGRHGRKKRRSGRKFKGIPEIGEMIAKGLPGAEAAAGRNVQMGVKSLWLLDGVIQRLLWYWLVVDVTIDFFYEWSSLLNETEFCKKSNQKRVLATADSGAGIGLLGWQALTLPTVEYVTPPLFWNVSSIALGPGRWNVTVAAKSTVVNTPLQLREVGVFADAGFSQPIFTSGPATGAQFSAVQVVAAGAVTGPVTITVGQFTSSGTAAITEAMCWVQQDI